MAVRTTCALSAKTAMWSPDNGLQMSMVLSKSLLRFCLRFHSDGAVPLFRFNMLVSMKCKPRPDLSSPDLKPFVEKRTFNLGVTLVLEHFTTPETEKKT